MWAMDKTCLEVRDLMALGGEVSPNERIAIESHVAVCTECARELAETRTMLGNLALLREGDMPADAPAHIWRGIQSAIPGSRRPAILTWTARVAATLVIGLSVGYTTKSVANRMEPGAAVVEESSPDDSRPTFVPRTDWKGAFDGRFSEPNPPAGPTLQPAPQSWSLHHLPYVDDILDPDVVRF